MEADIASRYEVPRTAQFLRDGAYTRIALQVILHKPFLLYWSLSGFVDGLLALL